MASKKKKEAEDIDKEVSKVEDEEQVQPKSDAEGEEGTQSSEVEQGAAEVKADKESDESTAEDTGAEQKDEPDDDKKEEEKEADVTAESEQKDESSKKKSKSKEDAKAESEQKDEPEPKKEKVEEAVAKEEEKGKKKDKKKDKKDKKKEELPPGAHLEPLLVEDQKKREETDEDVAERYAAEAEVSKKSDEVDETKDGSEDATPEVRGEKGEGDVEQKPKSKPVKIDPGKKYQATGKRKRSIARVNLKAGSGEMVVNNHSVKEYFPRDLLQHKVFEPLRASGAEGQVDIVARVHGGGIAGQAQAVGHGIARALVSADPELRAVLKKRGHLTRDARVKERRKAGLKKARKRPQFSKR